MDIVRDCPPLGPTKFAHFPEHGAVSAAHGLSVDSPEVLGRPQHRLPAVHVEVVLHPFRQKHLLDDVPAPPGVRGAHVYLRAETGDHSDLTPRWRRWKVLAVNRQVYVMLVREVQIAVVHGPALNARQGLEDVPATP